MSRNGQSNGTALATRPRVKRSTEELAVEAESGARLAKARTEKKEADLRRKALSGISRAMAHGGALSLASYGNAQATRLRGRDRPRGGSADGHRSPATLDTLRRMCQDLDRNNVLARGLSRRRRDMVLSDGFGLIAQTADPEWNKRTEALFWAWAGYPELAEDVPEGMAYPDAACDVRGRWCLHDFADETLRSADFDGDLGINLTRRGQLQAVEAERIASPSGPGTINTANMAGGVEMDDAGKALRYHVWSWDPALMTMARPVAVPAEQFILLVNPLRDITGSTRGEPQLAAALDRFEHLSKFEEAVRIAARVHASLAFFVKSNRPDLAQAAWTGEDVTNADGNAKRELDLEPLTIKFLGPNEEMQAFAPTQPMPNLEQFVFLNVVMICADLGLPLPLALLDGRQVNLSSIRSVMQFAWRNFRRSQAWLGRCFYSRVYRWRVAMWIREGVIPFRDDWARHEFTAPPAPVMDPEVEIRAQRLAVNACFKSNKRAMAELGIDRDSEWDEIVLERKRQKKDDIAPFAGAGETGVTQQVDEAAGDTAAAPGGGPPGSPPKAGEGKAAGDE